MGLGNGHQAKEARCVWSWALQPTTSVTPRRLKKMFITALFIITPNRKLFQNPSAGKWINKLCCIQAVENYSAVQRDKLRTCAKQGGSLTPYVREGRQTQKARL